MLGNFFYLLILKILTFLKNSFLNTESALNLPGTPNTSSEYYMECAARANDGFEKRNKIKNNFCSQVFRILLFSGF